MNCTVPPSGSVPQETVNIYMDEPREFMAGKNAIVRHSYVWPQCTLEVIKKWHAPRERKEQERRAKRRVLTGRDGNKITAEEPGTKKGGIGKERESSRTRRGNKSDNNRKRLGRKDKSEYGERYETKEEGRKVGLEGAALERA